VEAVTEGDCITTLHDNAADIRACLPTRNRWPARVFNFYRVVRIPRRASFTRGSPRPRIEGITSPHNLRDRLEGVQQRRQEFLNTVPGKGTAAEGLRAF